MHLLDTTTIKLQSFGANPPPYAIISHSWTQKEVKYSDLSQPDVEQKEGYAKLSAACDMARRLGFRYLWMDSCCVAYPDSVEISRELTSMYTRFQNAHLSIVYLRDVGMDDWQSSFEKAVWFTRAWTLQELIAPRQALFVTRDWDIIGTKMSLARLIANITGVDEHVLLTGNMDGISIARKISWVAHRKVIMAEDLAYSLMGIFGVNMPVIYGEGDKAFIRLQEEIMKRSTDQSIFAWCKPLLDGSGGIISDPITPELHSDTSNIGLLAPSPSYFGWAKDVVHIPFIALENILHVQDLDGESTHTNRGVRMRLPLQLIDKEKDLWMAFLACGGPDGKTVFAMFLRRVSLSQFTRVAVGQNVGGPHFYLAKVPFDSIPVSDPDVTTMSISIASQISQSPDTQQSTGRMKVQILVDYLRVHLERQNLILVDQSWGEGVDDHEHYWLFYDHERPHQRDSEIYFFVEDNGWVLLMLVVTLTMHALEIVNRPIPRVDVRAITIGPDGDIPASVLSQSPREVYEAWSNTAPALDLSEPPPFPMVKLLDGMEIGFAMTPSSDNSDHWYIWPIQTT